MEEKKKEVVARVATPPAPPKELKSKGTRLPDDWQPSADDLAYGAQKGLLPHEIARATEKFKFWAASASGPNSIKRNWSMAYRNWLLSDAEKLGRKAPAPSAAVEAVPQFQTDEEHQAWWNDRHRRLAAAAGGK